MKTKVDKGLIEHVAEVSRLKLTEKEKIKFLKELKEVIEAFSKIDKADTKNVDISLQPVELKNALRDDKEENCLKQDEVLSLTEHKKDGYFKGPKAV
jgi:aspartyl-tRNA(Asn)/glutamyl-tRNA(Gln) amidotransferase subunit C|tara:strand:+ start:85 stop:375 length:291 start_codon:yes stop_codon:yes gene_type:complete